MTRVLVKQSDKSVLYIEVYGHANFSSFGNDVVCAGISSIVFGTLNSLCVYGLDDSNIEVDDTYIKINLTSDDSIQIIANTMLIQLKTIQDSYPDYITIKTI